MIFVTPKCTTDSILNSDHATGQTRVKKKKKHHHFHISEYNTNTYLKIYPSILNTLLMITFE